MGNSEAKGIILASILRGKINKRRARWLGAVVLLVLGSAGINSLLIWTPPSPDPRTITRENFGFEMFSQVRLLGLDTRHDVSGAQDKLNELFPSGTPLDEFIKFEYSIKVPKDEYERFGYKNFSCEVAISDKICVCWHSYPGLGALRGSNDWGVFAKLGQNNSIEKIEVKLHFNF